MLRHATQLQQLHVWTGEAYSEHLEASHEPFLDAIRAHESLEALTLFGAMRGCCSRLPRRAEASASVCQTV